MKNTDLNKKVPKSQVRAEKSAQLPTISGIADGFSKIVLAEDGLRPPPEKPQQLLKYTASLTTGHVAVDNKQGRLQSAAQTRPVEQSTRLLKRPQKQKSMNTSLCIGSGRDIAPQDFHGYEPHPPSEQMLATMCDRTNRLTVDLTKKQPSRAVINKPKESLTYIEEAYYKPGIPNISAKDSRKASRLKPVLQPVPDIVPPDDVRLPALKTRGYHQEPLKPIPRVAPIVPYVRLGSPYQDNMDKLPPTIIQDFGASEAMIHVPKPPQARNPIDINELPCGHGPNVGPGASVMERRKRRILRRQ